MNNILIKRLMETLYLFACSITHNWFPHGQEKLICSSFAEQIGNKKKPGTGLSKNFDIKFFTIASDIHIFLRIANK